MSTFCVTGSTLDAVIERELIFSDDANRNKYDKVIEAFHSYFYPVESLLFTILLSDCKNSHVNVTGYNSAMVNT